MLRKKDVQDFFLLNFPSYGLFCLLATFSKTSILFQSVGGQPSNFLKIAKTFV